MHLSILSTGLALLAGAVQTVSAASAGCGKSPPSSGTKSMTVAGQNRQYILQVPENYDPNKAYRLVFGYHWLSGSMTNVAPGYYGLRDLARGSTIFVAPNGLNNGWANTNGNDVTFTDQMIDTIKNSMCVDEDQIFATGFSYGGGMSYSLACSRANVFRAVAVIAGAQLSGCAGGNTPIAYLGIHGVVDSVLPISSGRQLRDKYLGLNGCANKNAPEPSSGSGTHIKTTYDCREGYPVWWIAHSGDHTGSPQDRNGQYWAPGETWDFFNLVAGSPSGPPSGTTTAVPPPATTTANPPPTGNCSPRWGQCGGNGWSGANCCQSGSTCQYINDWYSQCL